MADAFVVAGRYRALRLLGEGGSGRVYLARDDVEQTVVALKVIQLGPGQNAARVEREAAALRHLRIPGVVRLFDVGREGDAPFIVMEYIAGKPFPGVSGPVPWSVLGPLVTRLLDILARVHAAGVLHRDLKPGNVLVTEDQRVVLLDFGLACGPPIGVSITASSELLGTFHYLSPEQLETGRVDARSELYSVGLMVYEALLGRSAGPAGDRSQGLRSRLTRELTPIRVLLPDLPQEAAQLVDRLVRRTPEERPRSAGDALRMLRGDTGVVSPGPMLQRLGSRIPLDRVVHAVERGESVDVGGAPGSGRTRLLYDAALVLGERGRRVWWAVPGEGPFQSVRHLVGRPGDGEDPVRIVEARLLALCGEGAIFADDVSQLDRWTRALLGTLRTRMSVVQVADTPGAIRLDPLTELDLRALFHGPDRVLHLREDAARELYLRSSGRPRHVVHELAAWESAGLAHWEHGCVRISRDTLNELAEGVRGSSALPDDAGTTLDRRQRDVLAWVALAGQAATIPRIAVAMQQDLWEVRVEVDGLADAGALAVEEDGRIRLLSGTGDLASWSAERRQLAHRAIAAQLEPGQEGRLGHLLEAGDRAGARDECLASGTIALEQGNSGRAYSLLQIGVGLARETRRSEFPFLVGMASAAAELDSPRRLDTILYEIRRVKPDPLVADLRSLVECMLLAYRGILRDAEAAARAIGPFPDIRLEAERLTILARAVLSLRPSESGEFLVGIERLGDNSPEFRSRWMGWVGHHFRNQRQYPEAMRWHLAATRVEGTRRRLRSGLYNAAVCALDALDLETAAAIVADLRRAARDAGAPVFELRAESLARNIAARRGEVEAVDMELVLLAEMLASPVDYMIFFQEAVIARAIGQLDLAAELAGRCRELGVRRDLALARVSGEVLARRCGASPRLEDAVVEADLVALSTPRLRVQFMAEYGRSLSPEQARPWLDRVEADHAQIPAEQRREPMEVTSPDAALAALREHVHGEASPGGRPHGR